MPEKRIIVRRRVIGLKGGLGPLSRELGMAGRLTERFSSVVGYWGFWG